MKRETRPGASHSSRFTISTQRRLILLGWGTALTVGITFPMYNGGYLWLLDWVSGPHAKVASSTALGLQGGLVTGLPFAVLQASLMALVHGVGTWLPLVVLVPVAAYGAGRLTDSSLAAQLGAATLYCVNPFVFQRIFVGHIPLLVGYALLPYAARAVFEFFAEGASTWVPMPALWWGVLTAFSAHFAWVYGIVIISGWLTNRPARAGSVIRLVSTGIAFAALSLYLLLPHLATRLGLTTATSGDLHLYRTTGDPHLGLFLNVLGFYGFWRMGPGPELPKQVVAGWPFLLLAMLLVAVIGTATAIRRPADLADCGLGRRRRLAVALLIIGLTGYVLALGDQGPAGGLFRWAYFHVPFFAIMREPQKFLMLTLLSSSVLFGWGIQRLVGFAGGRGNHRRSAIRLCLAVLLPLAYTPTIFGALAGQVGNTEIPQAWEQVDAMMGNGPGNVLFLPWHLYMSFPFVGRVIANPSPTSFRRNVIAGDNVEAGPGEDTTSTSLRSAYLQTLFDDGGSHLHDFGSRVAALGVEYVVLAKTVDWARYRWLNSQRDLRLVTSGGGLEMWRNTAYDGVGHSATPRTISEVSPIAYRIGPGEPGTVVLDSPYQEGWKLGTQAARPSAQGVISFEVGRSSQMVTFTPWRQARRGYVLSGTAFLLLIGASLAERWRVGRRSLPMSQN